MSDVLATIVNLGERFGKGWIVRRRVLVADLVAAGATPEDVDNAIARGIEYGWLIDINGARLFYYRED